MLQDTIGSTMVHDGTASPTYYTPPFGRGGERAVFTFETTHITGVASVSPTIEHKNAEDTTWASAGSASAISSTGMSSVEISGIKEEVRISFTFGAGNQGDFIHVLIPAPMWLPY